MKPETKDAVHWEKLDLYHNKTKYLPVIKIFYEFSEAVLVP